MAQNQAAGTVNGHVGVKGGRSGPGAVLAEVWFRLKNSVTAALLGISGALTVGSVQHVVQTCRGNCAGCGSCAVALAAAVVSASAGVAGRTAGRRRLLWIGAVVLAGLALYGLLTAFRRGFLP